SLFTEFAQTADEFRFHDANVPERCKHGRWMAERNSEVVGYAEFGQHSGIYHPHKFYVEIGVDQDRLNQGIGSALYARLIDQLRPHRPRTLQSWCREDMPCYVRFLERRGFEAISRMWVSELDLDNYDPTPFQRYTRAVLEDGVQIKTRAELSSDSDLDRKL